MSGIDYIDELAFMLLSGSDRIGALDFQTSPRDYVPAGKRQRNARKPAGRGRAG